MTDEQTESLFLIYLRGLPEPIQFVAESGSVRVKDEGALDWSSTSRGPQLIAVEPQEITAVVEVPAAEHE